MVSNPALKNVTKVNGKSSPLTLLKGNKKPPIDADPIDGKKGSGVKGSTRVKNKPWGLPEPYVDCVINHGQYRSEALKKQLKLLVMEGGSVSSRAVNGVDRGVLYRALKRFGNDHNFIQTGMEMMQRGTESC